MTWTDERVAMLKELAAQKLSAAQIAKEMGGDISRGAVIGKMHRLGISSTYVQVRHGRKPRPTTLAGRGYTSPGPQKRRPRPRVIETRLSRVRASLQFDQATDLPLEARSPFACTLMELSSDTCRWPLGDPRSPDFRYCGDKPFEDLPYCVHHSRIAYRDPRDRGDFLAVPNNPYRFQFRQAAE